jgi:thiopurine S-methyltransferase
MMPNEKPTHLPDYWSLQYQHGRHGWNIGSVSTPLKVYFDQLIDRNIKILIPGAGFGWEAGYLFEKGFHNTYVLDFSEEALSKFRDNFPEFPSSNILHENFFTHQGAYDLIVEQTFFSSIPRDQRNYYVQKTYQLLRESGKLCGLLFNHEFNFEGPPFGGTSDEYQKLFAHLFDFKTFETSYNSIKPRSGRELFLLLEKK